MAADRAFLEDSKACRSIFPGSGRALSKRQYLFATSGRGLVAFCCRRSIHYPQPAVRVGPVEGCRVRSAGLQLAGTPAGEQRSSAEAFSNIHMEILNENEIP